jgi:large subunit ribosomal protein L13
MQKKTFIQKPAEVIREWHVIDAKGQVLGQVATQIATKLMGKHKPTFTSHVDGGDYVIVINAAEVAVTGAKVSDKKYYSYSGFPGGLRVRSFGEMQAALPGEVIRKAVYNMLPKNRLRSPRMERLKIYSGAEHKHHSQLASKKA